MIDFCTLRSLKKCFPWVKRLILIVCLLSTFHIINEHFFKIVIVNGNSMVPTLEDGQIVIVKLGNEQIDHSDIVLLNAADYSSTQDYWLKRVIGVADDVVELNSTADVVAINGESVHEPYTQQVATIKDNKGDTSVYKVPKDHYFVMGDNRSHSVDSRSQGIGPIPASLILGKVVHIVSP